MREKAGWNICVCIACGLVASIATLAFSSKSWASGDANHAACPSATESSAGFRTYLPDCRAYELVTPPYKDGAVVITDPGAVANDGERVIAGVPGAFAGQGNMWLQTNANSDTAVYEFTRGSSAWEARSVTPPASRFPYSSIRAASVADGLATTLWGGTANTQLFKEDLYLRRPDGSFVPVGPGYGPEVASEEIEKPDNELQFVGGAANLSRMFFSIEGEEQNGHSNLWPGDNTVAGRLQNTYSLYEYQGTDNTAPTLVGVSDGTTVVNGATLPTGTQITRCGTELGAGRSGSNYNAASEDGSVAFFTANASTSTCSTGASEPQVNEIYARVDDSVTLKISEPTKADCTACQSTSGETTLRSAVYQGASSDGKKAFFVTSQELLPGFRGLNLYQYDREGPAGDKITAISRCSAQPVDCSNEAGVQGVVRIAQSGNNVFFVATGKLTAKNKIAGRNPEEAAPIEGADNLYVYNAGAGEVEFVATIMTEEAEARLKEEEEAERQTVSERAKLAAFAAYYEALSQGKTGEEAFREYIRVFVFTESSLAGTLGPAGTLPEDKTVWAADDKRPAQATADGRFLLFLASADITSGDTSTVPQLFEYDVEAHELMRVSIGQTSSGNVTTFHESPKLPIQRYSGRDLPTEAHFHVAVSEDGSTVLFLSAAELAPGATSGRPSVFEYHKGAVYLISDGVDSSSTGKGPSVQLLGIAGGGTSTPANIFFTTERSLVPQQGDSQVSLYDARENGGFPAPTLSTGCIGETCRGAEAAAPDLAGAASATTAPEDAAATRPASRPHKRRAASKRRHRRKNGRRSRSKKSALRTNRRLGGGTR